MNVKIGNIDFVVIYPSVKSDTFVGRGVLLPCVLNDI